MTSFKKSFQYGQHTVTLETGEIARQATGAVMVSMDDTSVLVTVVAKKEAIPGRDFFPLTVNYQERTYAAGKIPGGFFRREGRPSEKETLTCRLIDRPIRPLFPKGFINEVQVVATVVSLNKDIDPDIPAMIGASAALAVSGIPFNGPIGAARVGYVNGQYVLNPTYDQLATSKLDLVVAGTKNAVLMVESEAQELPEQTMLEAVLFGHEQMQTAIEAIESLAAEVNPERWQWQAPERNASLQELSDKEIAPALQEAYRIEEKQARQQRLSEIRSEFVAKLCAAEGGEPVQWSESDVVAEIEAQEKQIVRGQILDHKPRIDGRDTRTCGPSPSVPGCCRGPTVPPCSPAGRPRPWWSPPSAPAATPR